MPYLIDGHNLIHYLDDVRLDDPDDEAKLVLKLRGFCARTRKKCVVVFDEGLPGGTSSLSTPSVRVVFASSRQTNADRIIRERIRLTRDVKGWTVVSSDNEVLDAAQRAGMRGMKCAIFAERLDRPEEPYLHEGLRENVMVSDAEVAEWMTLFEIDESEISILDEDVITSQNKASTTAPEPDAREPSEHRNPPKTVPTRPGVQKPLSARAGQLDKEVDYWLDVFGEDPIRPPTDSRPERVTRLKSEGHDEGVLVEPPADEALKSADTGLSKNSVAAWLDVFGEEDSTREPTDPAPQRSDPSKQGRYKSHDGKRQPTVHKRMATSDDIYLSDGEVDAWLDVFGVDEPEE